MTTLTTTILTTLTTTSPIILAATLVVIIALHIITTAYCHKCWKRSSPSDSNVTTTVSSSSSPSSHRHKRWMSLGSATFMETLRTFDTVPPEHTEIYQQIAEMYTPRDHTNTTISNNDNPVPPQIANVMMYVDKLPSIADVVHLIVNRFIYFDRMRGLPGKSDSTFQRNWYFDIIPMTKIYDPLLPKHHENLTNPNFRHEDLGFEFNPLHHIIYHDVDNDYDLHQLCTKVKESDLFDNNTITTYQDKSGLYHNNDKFTRPLWEIHVIRNKSASNGYEGDHYDLSLLPFTRVNPTTSPAKPYINHFSPETFVAPVKNSHGLFIRLHHSIADGAAIAAMLGTFSHCEHDVSVEPSMSGNDPNNQSRIEDPEDHNLYYHFVNPKTKYDTLPASTANNTSQTAKTSSHKQKVHKRPIFIQRSPIPSFYYTPAAMLQAANEKKQMLKIQYLKLQEANKSQNNKSTHSNKKKAGVEILPSAHDKQKISNQSSHHNLYVINEAGRLDCDPDNIIHETSSLPIDQKPHKQRKQSEKPSFIGAVNLGELFGVTKRVKFIRIVTNFVNTLKMFLVCLFYYIFGFTFILFFSKYDTYTPFSPNFSILDDSDNEKKSDDALGNVKRIINPTNNSLKTTQLHRSWATTSESIPMPTVSLQVLQDIKTQSNLENQRVGFLENHKQEQKKQTASKTEPSFNKSLSVTLNDIFLTLLCSSIRRYMFAMYLVKFYVHNKILTHQNSLNNNKHGVSQNTVQIDVNDLYSIIQQSHILYNRYMYNSTPLTSISDRTDTDGKDTNTNTTNDIEEQKYDEDECSGLKQSHLYKNSIRLPRYDLFASSKTIINHHGDYNKLEHRYMFNMLSSFQLRALITVALPRKVAKLQRRVGENSNDDNNSLFDFELLLNRVQQNPDMYHTNSNDNVNSFEHPLPSPSSLDDDETQMMVKYLAQHRSDHNITQKSTQNDIYLTPTELFILEFHPLFRKILSNASSSGCATLLTPTLTHCLDANIHKVNNLTHHEVLLENQDNQTNGPINPPHNNTNSTLRNIFQSFQTLFVQPKQLLTQEISSTSTLTQPNQQDEPSSDFLLVNIYRNTQKVKKFYEFIFHLLISQYNIKLQLFNQQQNSFFLKSLVFPVTQFIQSATSKMMNLNSLLISNVPGPSNYSIKIDCDNYISCDNFKFIQSRPAQTNVSKTFNVTGMLLSYIGQSQLPFVTMTTLNNALYMNINLSYNILLFYHHIFNAHYNFQVIDTQTENSAIAPITSTSTAYSHCNGTHVSDLTKTREINIKSTDQYHNIIFFNKTSHTGPSSRIIYFNPLLSQIISPTQVLQHCFWEEYQALAAKYGVKL